MTILTLFSNVRYSILAHIFPNWWYYTWPLMYYMIGVAFSYNKNILKDFFSNSKILFWITLIISTLAYIFFDIHLESVLHVNIFIVIITTCIFSWLLNLDIKVNSKLRPAIIFVSNNTLLAYLNQITNMNMRFSMFPVIVVLNFILIIILVIIIRFILSTLSKSIKFVKR